MNTDGVRVFTSAVDAGSLAEAARRLGIPAMAASRRLAALETSLGIRLMHRTTRALSLTPEGETFLPYARSIIDNEQEATSRLRSDGRGAAGLLRVSVSAAFGLTFVAPLVPRLLMDNPELRISLDVTDTLPDLVATGIDLAIRIAHLRDNSLIAQKLADNPRLLVAAPDYLHRRGQPVSLADLAMHDCLPLNGITHWTMRDDTAPEGEREKHIRLQSRFSSSSIAVCHAACLAGGGIALLSHWAARDDLRAGRLVGLTLADGAPENMPIWAVYPTSRMVLPKVRVFVLALQQAFATYIDRQGEQSA
jgi:DNA-binding transcriptional LysR family regulator